MFSRADHSPRSAVVTWQPTQERCDPVHCGMCHSVLHQAGLSTVLHQAGLNTVLHQAGRIGCFVRWCGLSATALQYGRGRQLPVESAPTPWN
jgi:hypothetical protein